MSRAAPLLVASLAIALSTALLVLTAGVYGVVEGWYDSAAYLSGAVNLLHGQGLSIKAYDLASDTIRFQPITHYPPLTSLVYALLLLVGIPFAAVPTVTILCCWLVFLAGIGTLTYRLSGSWWGGAIGVVVASLTHSYLVLFQTALSEPVFLPLLVWSVVALVGLPEEEKLPPLQMGAAIVLLALMMLTRYAGSVLFGAVGLWWVWQRFDWKTLSLRQVRRVVGEGLLLSLAFVPMALWMVRNWWVAEGSMGQHAEQSRDTLWDGISGLLNQLSQLVLPALRPLPSLFKLQLKDWGSLDPWIPWLHLAMQLAVVGFLFFLGRRLWRVHGKRQQPLALPSSPILPMVAAFLALYVLLQPFFSFKPMDFRDSTTLLCLLQPWLIAVVIRRLREPAYPLLALYASVNLLLVVIPITAHCMPGVLSLRPLRVAEFSPDTTAHLYCRQHGGPSWLIVSPVRMTFFQRQYPDVTELWSEIDELGTDVVIIGTLTHVLFFDEERGYVPGRLFKGVPGYQEILDWVAHGQCTSQYPVFLLIYTRLPSSYIEWAMSEIEQKCPDLEPEVSENMIIYRLGDHPSPGNESRDQK